MKRRIVSWAAILALAGPTLITPSCSGMFLREIRDAVIGGATIFVQQLTIDLLSETISGNQP